MSSLLLEEFARPAAFARDPRFAGSPVPAPVTLSGETLPDPVAEAYEHGLRDGAAAAAAEAERRASERDAASGAIELAFARLDDLLGAQLAERLHQTVLALCEASVAPLAIDPAGLTARIERAVAMLQRAQDERIVLVNPEDLDLVRDRLPQDLRVRADKTVERGGLRIETADGGIEDGPTTWRRTLLETFREC